MKTIQNTIVIVLLFIANAAAAQSFTKMQSSVRRPGEGLYESAAPAFRSTSTVQLAGNLPSAEAPSYKNSNSMLERKITINPTQYKVSANLNPFAAATPIIVKGSLSGGSSGSGIGGATPGNPGTGSGENQGETDNGLNLNPGKGGTPGLTGKGEEDLANGQYLPIGDALIPFLLMLLMYALFLLVRGDVRNEQEIME